MEQRTGVLILDSSYIFRRALARYLSQETDVEVVGITDDRDEALAMVRLLKPAVVILDADTGSAAIEVTATISSLFPQVAVVALTSSTRDQDIYMAVRAGVAAVLPKSVSEAEIATAIRSVASDGHSLAAWLGSRPEVLTRLRQDFQSLLAEHAQQQMSEGFASPLSGKELEILGYIAQGNSNKRIAGKMGMKEQSIKNYVTTILRKIPANDRAHAISIALKHGWIVPK